jgi:hypothetical protein
MMLLRFYAAAFATAFVDLEMIQGEALFDSDADPGAEGRWQMWGRAQRGSGVTASPADDPAGRTRR